MTVTRARAARTYEVRTYGCQMNVHDSERLAGLLEDAGYARRGRGRRRADVVVFNTCAVRENADNRLYGNLGHLRAGQGRPPRHADRRRRLPGAEGPRRDRPQRRRGSTWCSAPTTSARCRCCWSAPASSDEAQVEIMESLEVFPSHAADPARVRLRRVGRRSRVGLQQHLHLLHRAVAARQGEGPAARRRSSPRSRRSSAEGVLEITLLGQNVNSYGVEFGDRLAFGKLLRACGDIDGLERVRFTSPHPRDFTDDVIAAMAETPNVMPQLHMPLQSGSDRAAEGDAPLLPAGALPRHHRPGPRRHARRRHHHRHHRRLPRRDRGGLPGRPSTSYAQARFASAFTFQYSKRPGTPAADHGRPDPQGGRAGALRASGRAAGGDLLGGEQASRSAGRVEVLVAEGEGRKDERHRAACPAAPPTTASSTSRPATIRRGRATWSRSRSPTRRRTTWWPTARWGRYAARGRGTPGRRGRAPRPGQGRLTRHAHHRPPAVGARCRGVLGFLGHRLPDDVTTGVPGRSVTRPSRSL